MTFKIVPSYRSAPPPCEVRCGQALSRAAVARGGAGRGGANMRIDFRARPLFHEPGPCQHDQAVGLPCRAAPSIRPECTPTSVSAPCLPLREQQPLGWSWAKWLSTQSEDVGLFRDLIPLRFTQTRQTTLKIGLVAVGFGSCEWKSGPLPMLYMVLGVTHFPSL